MPGRSTTAIPPRLLSFADAAAYTGFSERQLRRWKEKHQLPIPIVSVMGRNYFDRSDVDVWLDGLPRVLPTDANSRVTRNSKRKTRKKGKKS